MERQLESRVHQAESRPGVQSSPQTLSALSGQSNRLLSLQRQIGNQAVGRLLQAKLTIGQSGDLHEQEADRGAEQTVYMPEPTLRVQRTCACNKGACTSCQSVESKLAISRPNDQYEQEADRVAAQIMRVPDPQVPSRKTSITASVAPQLLSANLPSRLAELEGTGHPLPAEVRRFFEPRFGNDLGHVRIHTDSDADRLARDVNARAFTIGPHIVFAADSWSPHSHEGRHILAHELAHVHQQGAMGGQAYTLHRQVRCQGILDASIRQSLGGGRGAIGGVTAHRLITIEFIRDMGTFRRLNIPAGTRAPYATEECSSDVTPSEIDPLIYNPNPRSRAGAGIPDLLHWTSGGIVEIAEIKPATWGCFDFAERQVQNYVDKGDRAEDYRRERGISGFTLMPLSSWASLPLRLRAGRNYLLADWCSPGIVGYLGVRDDDPNVFVCTLSDQGRIDQFLDNMLGRARTEVDRFVNIRINRVLHDLINRLSLRELLRLVGGDDLANRLPPGFEADPIAQRIEAELRRQLHLAKDRFLNQLQQKLQANLRQYLQSALNTLCAGALAISVDQLLEQLRRDLRRLAAEAAVAVAYAMLAALMEQINQAIAEFLGEYGWAIIGIILAILAIVAIVALVLDNATGIGFADDPLIAPAVALLARAVAMMRPLLAVFSRLPALAGALGGLLFGPAGALVPRFAQ